MTPDSVKTLMGHSDHNLCVYAGLDIEINHLSAALVVEGETAQLRFSSLPIALAALKTVLFSPAARELIPALRNLLSKLGITLYIQNRYWAVLGPNSNPVLSGMINLAAALVHRRA